MRGEMRRERDDGVLRGEEQPGEAGQDREIRVSRFTLAHRYVDRKVALHLHVWGMGEGCKFCVVFERAESNVHRHPGTGIAWQHDEFPALVPTSTSTQCEVVARSTDQMQQPMTVESRQIVQTEQAQTELMSVVRLHRLDDCLSLLGKRFDLERAAVRRGLSAPVLCEVLLPLRVDRERGVAVGILTGESPREVVEGGARVLQEVAHGGSEVGRTFLDDLDAVLRSFRFCITNDSIRVSLQEGVDFMFERFVMLLRSQELYKKPLIDLSEFIVHD